MAKIKYMLQFDEICKKSCETLTVDKLAIVGKNIKKLRLKNKLTQSDIAFYVFSDKSLISSLERGAQKNVTLLTLIKLSELFSIKVEELFKND